MYLFEASVLILVPLITIGYGQKVTDLKWEAGNKSYFYVTDTSRNFQQSKQFCESQNTTLVQIKSRDEQQFLDKHISTNYRYWMGVDIASGKPVTKFSDGTNIEWFNWVAGHPTGREPCVFVGAGTQQWYDDKCDRSDMAVTVCEKRQNTKNPLLKEVKIGVSFQPMINS